MPDKKDNNTQNNPKQGTNNINVGSISNSSGVIIGSNISVEGGINVTTVIQEIRSYGLKYLPPDYFRVNTRTSFQGFDKWKNGFPFKLQDIMHEHHFQRTDIINDIINKLDDNNGDHALLLLGKSGTSKSILLMDIMCHYFKNNYIVFYNFGEEEIKDVYDLENSLIKRLKDGNKVLIAIDNVNDKKTAAIFSIIESLRSNEKRNNIRFILTGRQPEFDRFVNDRLDTVSEPVRQSIQNIYKQISYPIPNFTLKEIQNFLKRYKDEDDVNGFVKNNNFDYNKLFAENDLVTLNNISSFVYEKTNGDPILLKFFIFGKGFAADVESRFFNYMKSSEIKLQSMLVCVILDRAEIAISYDLIEKMNLTESAFELTNETLTFLEDEKRWKTIHPKWDLELLAYLYNVKEYAILEKRKNILRKSLESLINNLTNEHDKLSILGSLYDSTTIDTEENQKFPITIVESIVTNKNNLIYNSLSEDSRFDLYSYYISKNYYYSQLYDKSLTAVEEAIKIYPKKTFGLGIKGNILYILERYQESLRCYDEIITKLDPKHILTWFSKGNTLDKLGRYQESLQCYDEIITKLDPNHVLAWLYKGNTLDRLGRNEEAIKCYDEIITKLDPKHILTWLGKGNILGNLGRNEEAIKCYDEIITKLDPKYVLAWLIKGNTLNILERYQESLQCYDEIITKLDPKYVLAWLYKGNTLDRLGRNEEAIKCYDEIITKLDPKHILTWLGKGNILGNLGRNEEAIKCYDEIITKLDPKYVNAWYNKGNALDRLGQTEESLQCYDEIITKLDPKHILTWLSKGNTLDKLGRYQESLQCYDEIITKLDPNHVLAWLNKGVVLGNQDRNEEAIKCYDEIITKLDPKYVNAWYNKGNALDRLGQLEEAIKCYDEIITKLDPKHVLAWNNKGWVLNNLGQREEAIKCYDEIITKLDPKHVLAWLNKGRALDKLSRYQEAIECYDKALEIDSNDKYVLDSKGYTLSNLGKYEEAIEYFNKALKIDPNYTYPLEHKKIADEKLRNRNK